MSIIVGLDIGTATIKSLIAQIKPPDLELDILSQAKKKSSGVRKGVVINVDEVAENITSCLDKVQELSERRIKSVFVNIGGSHVFSTSSKGLISVSRADQKISQEDIERVIQAAQTFSLPSNKEILSVFPRKFTVDNEEGVKEPLGMQGVRLEAEVLVIGGFSPYLKNLTQAVLGAGFQIEDLVLTPIAAARAVLSPREKELGVAALDIGAGTTGLAVFEESNLIHAAILPIGSAHITNDIAIGFKCDIDTAEKIKLEFGTCLFKGTDKKKKIETLTGEDLTLYQKMLNRIIEARVSEIFEQINKELKKISRQALLPGGVVLTGGGAKLPKIKDLARKELKLPCRIGTPKGFLQSLGDPELSAVAGLVLQASDFEEESAFPAFGKEMISRLKRIFKIFIP
jgi:cell division protein FtsA